MVQADSQSTSRRTFVRQASAAALFGAAAGIPAQAAVSDPIFALIEAHRCAERELLEALAIETALDAKLPVARRRSSINGGELDIVAGDDPRWIASVCAVDAAQDATDQRAIDLLGVLPQTTAGLIALLRYAYEYAAAGSEWPTVVDNQRGRDHYLEWCELLPRHAADTIEALAVGR